LYDRLTTDSLDEFSRHHAAEKGDSIRCIQAAASKKELSALWTLLLCRVRDVAADLREEVRTGAISTLIRIFDNHGDDISADAWQMVLQAILLPLLSVDAKNFPEARKNVNQADVKSRVATSKLALEGIAKLLST
jgi:nicotinic acid mononucleotide adenylyltransferase